MREVGRQRRSAPSRTASSTDRPVSDASSQLRLALGPYANLKLFSDHFLEERLGEMRGFADVDARGLLHELTMLWESERGGLAGANEAQTEERFIKPVLQRLGFSYTVQAGVRSATGRRQPDYARFDRPLDGRHGADREDPVAQIVNYIVLTRCRWGVLTNGRLWRLYAAEGDLLEGAAYQVDLVELIEQGDDALFRFFAAFFSAGAFAPHPDGRCFLDHVLAESDANAVRVGRLLEEQIFGAVPLIAEGLLGADDRAPEALAAALDNALVLLYRMLFCLHAEARELLPVGNPHYLAYSVRRQRERLARDVDAGRVFARASDDIYNDLRALFRMIDSGEPALGVSEYDGGLFSAARHPYFESRSVPDDLLAPALDRLYRVDGQNVDYRDLSIRHLGTIYERLLEYRLEDQAGMLRLSRSDGRHRSGSYFTPEFIVDAIVERALDPVLTAISTRVASAGLRGDEALDALLSVRVCDPAMGSGHFIVGAAAYVAQWAVTDPSYDSDLSLLEVQRLVAERCVYGVDVNPMAVELARLSLWLATVRHGEPLAFLHNLRCGNSLVGASLDDLLGGGETVFADRLARDAEALLRGVAAIAERASHTGADVDEKEAQARAVEALRAPLEEVAAETIPADLVAEAGSPFHWELEFPEVFLRRDGFPRDDGGFDVVIGNPPYVRIQELGRRLADYARATYASARGSFDTYIPFIERGIGLLAPHGRLGFIVPNKFLRLDYGARLRRLLSDSRLVEEIIDFGDAQIFEGATNYTAIVVLDNAGRDGFAYRRAAGDAAAVRRALTGGQPPAERFSEAHFGSGPWILTSGDERRLIDRLAEGAERLDAVAGPIFTGLQTNADPVYILEDRGHWRSHGALYSRALEREVELEPAFLHPLASGRDIEPFAIDPLRTWLLFPYRRSDGQMRLATWEQIGASPRAAAYLVANEATLRGRERGRMDREGWWAYVYPKSLGLHDRRKLGVAATVRRLEVALDADGRVHFHNVRVNGILPAQDGPSLATLVVLLNSAPLDYVFRRTAAEHANGFFAANKQFIAPLPIRVPEGAEASAFDDLGRRLHACAAAIGQEREGFLTWLGDVAGARIRALSGWTALREPDRRGVAELIDILARNGTLVRVDPTERAFRDRLAAEVERSRGRLTELGRERDALLADAEARVADLYRLTTAQRRLVAEDAPHVSR